MYGFELLECIIANFPTTALEKYYVPILQLLLTRLQTSKTDTFALRFVRLYHFISAKDDKGFGADFFINIVEQVQANVFVQLYLGIILPDTAKLLRPLDRKTAVISLTKTLTSSQAFAERYGQKGWGLTAKALLQLLENPPVPPNSAEDTVVAEQDPDDVNFGVSFTQLTTIRRPAKDAWPEIVDVKAWAGEYLRDADGKTHGKISGFAQQRLEGEVQQVFGSYMRK